MPEQTTLAPICKERQARSSVGEWFVVLILAAGISGAIGGLLYALSVDGVDDWRALKIGALVGVLLPFVGLLVVAVWIVAPWLKLQITYRLETWFGTDLDRDGIQGDPAQPGRVMVVRGSEARAQATLIAAEAEMEKRVSLEGMVQFVLTCFRVGTSESAQGIKPNDRAKYLEARQILEDLGLVQWRNPTNHKLGWDIIGTQAQVIKHVREHLIER